MSLSLIHIINHGMSSVVFGEKLKMALQDLHRKINDRELLLSQDNVQFEDLDKQIREAKVDLQQCIPDLDRGVATALYIDIYMLETMSSTAATLRDSSATNRFRAERPKTGKSKN